MVYQKVFRKWIASDVCLVAELYPVQDFTRLYAQNYSKSTGMHGRASIEHVLGTPLLQVFGMLYIWYIKR